MELRRVSIAAASSSSNRFYDKGEIFDGLAFRCVEKTDVLMLL
jgi:hypothetical protein